MSRNGAGDPAPGGNEAPLTPISDGLDQEMHGPAEVLRKRHKTTLVLAQEARSNDGNYWAGLGAWLKPKGDWVMHRKVKKLRDISELLRTLCNDKQDTRCNECRSIRALCLYLAKEAEELSDHWEAVIPAMNLLVQKGLI